MERPENSFSRRDLLRLAGILSGSLVLSGFESCVSKRTEQDIGLGLDLIVPTFQLTEVSEQKLSDPYWTAEQKFKKDSDIIIWLREVIYQMEKSEYPPFYQTADTFWPNVYSEKNGEIIPYTLNPLTLLPKNPSEGFDVVKFGLEIVPEKDYWRVLLGFNPMLFDERYKLKPVFNSPLDLALIMTHEIMGHYLFVKTAIDKHTRKGQKLSEVVESAKKMCQEPFAHAILASAAIPLLEIPSLAPHIDLQTKDYAEKWKLLRDKTNSNYQDESWQNFIKCTHNSGGQR